MSANVHAGEAAVIANGREYIFRPSLRNIGNLSSDPSEIVKIATSIAEGGESAYLTALDVMYSCYSGEDDIFPVVGGYETKEFTCPYSGIKRQPTQFVNGYMAVEAVILLSLILLKNGMSGKDRNNPDAGHLSKFDPAYFVGVASAHLSISPDSAWNMTMIELQSALEAKYPSSEKSEGPTEEQLAYYRKAKEAEGNGR